MATVGIVWRGPLITRRLTATSTKRPSGKGPLKHVDYPHPDFRDLRKYLERRKSKFGELDYDVPVTIHYGNSVPVQMVTSVFDCCIEVGLTECALAADEVE